MRPHNQYEEFLMELIEILIEDALKAKQDVELHRNSKKEQYYEGRRMAYYEVLETIQDQLPVFQIDPKKIKFNINPDKDLL